FISLLFFPFRPPPRPTLFPYTTLFRSVSFCQNFILQLFLILIVSLTVLALTIYAAPKMQHCVWNPCTGSFCILYLVSSPLLCSWAVYRILSDIFLSHISTSSYSKPALWSIITSFPLFRNSDLYVS